ncbi:MAG TPA: hypothetical protein VGK61_01320 [Planctomycetota bacterium]|jgi:hypothetical protein
MMTLAAAILFGMVPQDEARLKDAWPKLSDAWKAVAEYKVPAGTGELDDEFLKVAGKLRDAFEAGGLFVEEGEYAPLALKAFIKVRARALAPSGASFWDGRGGRVAVFRRLRVAGGAPGAPDQAVAVESDPMGALLRSLGKLKDLKQGGLDDEENVQDEMVTVRKALKLMAITADETPAALRRRIFSLIRALALGEAYPESPKATEEQAKQFRAWIAELGHESIETREKATKELLRAGEASLPFVREALKVGDAEIVARARQLLGIGHAPWKTARIAQTSEWGMDIIVAPAAVEVPPAPAAEPPPKKDDKK